MITYHYTVIIINFNSIIYNNKKLYLIKLYENNTLSKKPNNLYKVNNFIVELA